MSLTTGTKLGPYEITAAVGAGGMGEVCRARDTRLGRDVAIKVLPENFAKDAVLKERFEREANDSRFLSTSSAGGESGAPLTLVVNWMAGLKKQ
jgi:serine/threonine protein kinase